MTIQHSVITDPDIHEPKGAAAAAADTIYAANGAGSGAWALVAYASLAAACIQSLKDAVETDIGTGTLVIPDAEVYVTVIIPDVSTASTILIPIPEDSEVLSLTTVLEGAITLADATVTLKNAADAAVASVTVAFTGSATGDLDQDAAPTNASLTGPTYLKLATDGGSTTAQRLFCTVHLKVTRTI